MELYGGVKEVTLNSDWELGKDFRGDVAFGHSLNGGQDFGRCVCVYICM